MSSADWWARKMRGEPAQKPAPLPPTPVAKPRPVDVPARPVAAPPSQGTRCPECGSGNYMGRGGNMPRCFDCGFVPNRDFRHSTQGLVGDGPSSPAPGQQSGSYNPQNIVGRVE